MKAPSKTPHQKTNYKSIINTPIGKLGVLITNNKIIKICFLSPDTRAVSSKNPLSSKITSNLKKYFSNPKEKLDLPFSLLGTPLQKKIWKLLKKIPPGQTITYGELAKKIGTSPRVIGNACRTNPLPILIPCHRVVGAKNIGGFFGKTNGAKIEIKKWLLNLEMAAVNNP